MQRRRPTGILIIAILMIISGIASVMIGLGVLSVGLALSTVTELELPGGTAQVFIGIGAFTLALGIATLIISWGLLKAKGWAWLLTALIAIISIIDGIFSMFAGSFWHILLIIIYGVIVYYLFRPEVKSYFGQGQILG